MDRESLSSFELETKIRKLLSEIIGPHFYKEKQLFKDLKGIQKNIQKQETSINALMVAKEEHDILVQTVESMGKKVEDVLSTTNEREAQYLKLIEDSRSFSQTINHKAQDNSDKINALFSKIDSIHQNTQKNKDLINSLKVNSSEKLHKAESDALINHEYSMNRCNDLFGEIKRLDRLINDINRNAVPQLSVDINTINRYIKDLDHQIKDMNSTKTNVSEFSELNNKVNGHSQELQSIQTSFLKDSTNKEATLTQIQENIPVYVYSRISETLYKTLELKSLRGLVKYEADPSNFFKEFKLDSSHLLDTIEERRLPFLQKLSRMNYIKSSISSKKNRENLESGESDIVLDSEEDPILMMEPLVKDIKKLKSEIQSLHAKNLSFESHFEDLNSRLNEQYTSTESNVESVHTSFLKSLEDIQNSNNASLKMIEDEISISVKRRKQEKNDLDIHFSNIKQETEAMQNETELLSNQLIRTIERVEKLTEFSKVLLLFVNQDERDKLGLQLTGYSEPKTPKSPHLNRRKSTIMLNPDCFSCSGQNPAIMKAFKMACINYNPSPITYESQSYTRKEAIELLGGFIGFRVVESRPRTSTKKRRHILNMSATSRISWDEKSKVI